ncbi:MAG: hypothetical protein ACU83U_11195 [Gammaproteobacteria bacterium]
MAMTKPRVSNILIMLIAFFVLDETFAKAKAYWIQKDPAYEAACQDKPFKESFFFSYDISRAKAEEKGYKINSEFSCIDKASFIAVNEANEKARQAACDARFDTRNLIQEIKYKASLAGYQIFNYHFDCIDKAAYIAMDENKAREKAAWKEAASLAVYTRKKQEEEKRMAESKRRQEESLRQLAEDEAQSQARMAALINGGVPPVDVNTATEAELAQVISFKRNLDVVAQIITERNKRPFDGWPDLVNRVVGLSSAQSAFYASVCGLNVKGESLQGAPANARLAAMLNEKLRLSH